MLNRNISIAALVCLAASVAAFGQNNQGTANVFQLPGSNSSNTAVVAYGYNSSSFSPSITAQGPAGATQVIAKPDGTKFYIVGSSLQVADSNFANIHPVAGVVGTPSAAAITSNGKYLVVGVASSVVVIDTSNDQAVASNLAMPSTIVSIATSRDSAQAFILTQSTFGSQITALSLLNFTILRQNTSDLQGNVARTLTLSPANLLYFTGINRIIEFDPSNLTITTNGTIALGGFTPGYLQFTSDGTTAYAVNTDHGPSATYSLVEVNLTNHSSSVWPPFTGATPPALDGVFVAAASRIFAFSIQTGLLYDVNPGPPVTATPSSLSGVLPVTNVVGAAISNEIPSSRYLYELVLTGTQDILYRVDLSTNQQSQAVTSPSVGGVLQFVAVPPQSGAVTPFVKTHNSQIIPAGTTSTIPFVARILDANGRPVYNQTVTFTPDANGAANGLSVNPTSAITNSDGYVQTIATAPNGGGLYGITIAAGAVSDVFSLSVPGGGGSGGSGGGASCSANCQVTIVNGDGQLIPGGNVQLKPASLTILVTDTAGKPLNNVSVHFNIDTGFGSLTTPDTVTDVNGLASTGYTAPVVSNQGAFQLNQISAVTAYGSVEFNITSYIKQTNFGPALEPGVTAITPDTLQGAVVTIGAGSVLSNAIVAQVKSNAFPQIGTPIPNVGIAVLNRILNPQAEFLVNSPAAHCLNDPLSDQTGTVSCTLAATTCTLGNYPVSISIGAFKLFDATINIVKGTASSFKKLAGDNQSGQAGKLLPITLTANVTDGCGNVVSGAPVSWAVTQGSATLSSTVNTSDSKGLVSTNATLGQTPGTVQIKLSLSTGESTTFTLTDSLVVSSLSVFSGNNQTAAINQNFSQPVAVALRDGSGNPVSGLTVTFLVTSGSANIAQASSITNAQGLASATVGAGPSGGPIVITASYSTFSATFNLTAQAPGPSITPASFTSAAYNALSTAVPGLAPCGLAQVTGPGLVPTPGITPPPQVGPLPYTLNGVVITVGGIPAPIQQTSNINGVQTVNFQVPCEVPVGTATVNVSVNGSVTPVPGVIIAQALPGIYHFTASNGKEYADVIGSDGNYVTPSNPARRGQTYYAVLTGLGQVSPPASTNGLGVGGQNVVVPIVVGIADAGVPGQIVSQYVVGATGLYIVAFQVAPNTPSGEQHFAIAATVNGQFVFGNQTFININ